MKVSIKDFQIVKSASLEFVPGLTVINGESNNGKSALFRAIKSCIYNEPGTTNVRVGCKNYLVGIEHRGHTVILQKGENSLYMIDGKQYNKIGKTQIPEVAEALGIKVLSINDNTEKINFWDQMEKPFLLDRNSSELFRFIVDSGEDDNLNNTLRSMVTDKNKLNVDKNLKEGSIATLKSQIEESSNLLAGSEAKIKLCEDVISFGPMTSKLLTTNNTITKITNETTNITNIKEEITKQKTVREEITSKINTLSYNISKKAQLNDALSGLNACECNIKNIQQALANKIDYKAKVQQLEENITHKTKLNDILTKLSQVNNVISTTKVDKIVMGISQDKINHLGTLKTVLDRLQVLQTSIDSYKVTKDALDKEIAPILEEYNKIEVCPYCGNKLHTGKEVAANEWSWKIPRIENKGW